MILLGLFTVVVNRGNRYARVHVHGDSGVVGMANKANPAKSDGYPGCAGTEWDGKGRDER